MKYPPFTPDMEAGRDRLHEDIAKVEKLTLGTVDSLAKSGIANQRWCAIARTHIEEGIMALHRSLRDFPGDDPNNYGKIPFEKPEAFTPPVDPEGNKQIAERRQIPWSDYNADGDLGPPKPSGPSGS